MNERDRFGLDAIGQVAVRVHDLERATRFYSDALGVRHLFTVPQMSFFDCGGVRLMLGVPSAPEFDHPASILYFSVGDIRTAHAVLVERGVHFEGPPHRVATLASHELWMAFLRDSEDNVLALMSEVPTA
jgi:predicted enzyme related to lactoylglutathione lyase